MNAEDATEKVEDQVKEDEAKVEEQPKEESTLTEVKPTEAKDQKVVAAVEV